MINRLKKLFESKPEVVKSFPEDGYELVREKSFNGFTLKHQVTDGKKYEAYMKDTFMREVRKLKDN